MKGFTLIEVLTTIILLGVITSIVTPVVLSSIKNSKENAYQEQIKTLLSVSEQYATMNSLGYEDNVPKKLTFTELKQAGLIKDDNVMDPKTSQPLEGCIIYKWVDAINQYEYSYETDCEITEEKPTVTINNSTGVFNSSGWSNKDFYIKVETSGQSYKYCISSTTCTPNTVVNKNSGTILVSNEGNNVICAVGQGNILSSDTKCTQPYKLDKTKPQFTGINDLTIQKGATIDLRNGVTANDSLSGLNGNFTVNPSSITTNAAGTTDVTYTVSDLAGNTQSITRKVIVDAVGPTVNFAVQGSPINGNGWAKANFYVKVDLVDNSGLGIKEAKWCTTQGNTCTPNTVMSGTSMTPQITVESNNNRICVQATDNNNKTSQVICSDAYKLDKTVPTAGTANISGTLGNASWYRSNVTIAPVNGSDSLSGHASTTTNISSITSDTSGTTITITTTDLAGNSATRTYTVKVDKTSPTFNLVADNVTWYQLTANISSVSDLSGVDHYEYYIKLKTAADSAYTLKYNGINTSYSFTDVSNSTYQIKVIAYDKAGNTTTKIVEQYVISCFIAGTPVYTENGYRNIEDIKIGDKVWTINLETNDMILKDVIKTYIDETSELMHITIGDEIVDATPRHRFYIIDKGWVRAYDLQVGDEVITEDGNLSISKVEYEKLETPITVYNFTVDDEHTYLVTKYSILVHNAGSPTAG